jgi:spore maturation protein CgeB
MNEFPPPDQDVVRALRRAQDRASRLYFECLQLRRDAKELGNRIEVVEGSIAYRLGAGIVSIVRAPWRLAGLPRLLLDLFRSMRERTNKDDSAERIPLLPADFTWSFEADPYSSAALAPVSLSGLRIAAVLDEFSHASFAPECEILQLAPQGFESDLDEFNPHFLLIESAWRGHRDVWRQKIHPVSAELCYLLDCCRRRGIPTVFWNKEDPSHFENFLASAGLFDHVFTTDITCIPRYREVLGHDRVYVLPFACQPSLQNPIEREPRQAAASFAGSWYQRYSERSKEFTRIVDAVAEVMPVDIYDRNAGRGDPSFEFPKRFHPLIKGRLPFSQIDKAYKGYRFGITINTVTSSPSMLARRIYELMACNTVVISNSAVALANGFAELALIHGKPGFAEELTKVASNEDARHRLQLKALRHVLGGHTMTHRLADMVAKVTGRDYSITAPRIVVFARVRTAEELNSVKAAYSCQSWRQKRLLLLTELGAESHCQSAGVELLDPADAVNAGVRILQDADWIALFDPRDHYGRQYLTDLALATSYCDVEALGKSRRFSRSRSGEVRLIGDERYRHAPISPRCSLIQAKSVDRSTLLLLAAGDGAASTITGLAVDEFNYCENGGSHNVEGVDVD